MPAEVRLSVSRAQDHDFCLSQTTTVTQSLSNVWPWTLVRYLWVLFHSVFGQIQLLCGTYSSSYLEHGQDKAQKHACFLSKYIYTQQYMKVRAYACQSKKEGKKPWSTIKKKNHTDWSDDSCGWLCFKDPINLPQLHEVFLQIGVGDGDVSICTSFQLLFSGETSFILLRRPPFPLPTHRPASWPE